MSSPMVGVVIGSRAEFTAIRRGLEQLRVMGVPYEFDIVSPERNPERVITWSRDAATRGIEVIIAAAGGSSPLPGLIAAHTYLPVIGVPVDSTPLRGQDALFSMVQMPLGSPVACVGINSAENAAILATRILALRHPHYAKVLQHQNQNASVRLDTALLEIRNQYPDLTDPTITAPDDHRLFITELETEPGIAFRDESVPKLAAADVPTAPIKNAQPPAPAQTRKASPMRVEIATPVPQEPQPAQAITPEAEPEAAKGAATQAAAESPTPPEQAPEKAEPKAEPPPEKPEAKEKEIAPRGKAGRQARRRSQKRPLTDRLFKIDPAKPDVDVIEHAMFTLLEGGIIAVPTDTVYGIAADATNAEAVERLYRIKGRDRQKALAILVHSTEMLSRLVTRFPEKVEELMDRFWPGSLTMIFPKPLGALAGVSATKSIGVRIPDHNTTLALISMVARPLATTSANLAGQNPATTAEEVVSIFADELDCILDAGPAPGNIASTVLSVVQKPYKILREGAIPRDKLREVLGDLLEEEA